MFQECSGMFHVPGFIDALYLGPIIISFEAVAKVFMNHAHM